MKILLLLTLYFPVHYVVNFAKMDPQEQFARNVFNHVAAKDYTIASDRYLEQKNFEDLIAHLSQKPNQVIIDREIVKYEEKKQRFINSFNESFGELSLKMADCDSIDWENAKMESLRYDYVIAKPDEEDVKILWPESKKHMPMPNEYLCNRSRIYFSDGKHSYVMHIESLYYNKEWWFFHKLRSPRIEKLK